MQLDRVRCDTGLAVLEVEEGDTSDLRSPADPHRRTRARHLSSPCCGGSRGRGRFQACRLAASRVGYGDAVAGETDAGGNRRRALDEFLEARMVEGYRIEAHEATHAIVVQGDDSLLRRLLGRRRLRFVVQVDDHGTVSMRPAEPVRH